MWQENVPAVELFLLCDTQWRYAPSGLVLGLDYPAVELVARMFGVELSADLFGRLQVLERELIKVRSGNDGEN